MKTLSDLICFLDQLYEKKIPFHLDKIRDSILIELTILNQMWEIEFMADGTIEIEKFISTGQKSDKYELDILIRDFAEVEENEMWDIEAYDKNLWGYLNALDKAKIFYTLDRDKNNASVTIIAVVPGQRWIIEIFPNGSIDVIKYLTTTDILDEKELDSLFILIEKSNKLNLLMVCIPTPSPHGRSSVCSCRRQS